ncbi:13557_t:CDS:2 [Funneliformis geosporum]|nr:13557_t:CDS:2 [Funneliformis geosporum]
MFFNTDVKKSDNLDNKNDELEISNIDNDICDDNYDNNSNCDG